MHTLVEFCSILSQKNGVKRLDLYILSLAYRFTFFFSFAGIPFNWSHQCVNQNPMPMMHDRTEGYSVPHNHAIAILFPSSPSHARTTKSLTDNVINCKYINGLDLFFVVWIQTTQKRTHKPLTC